MKKNYWIYSKTERQILTLPETEFSNVLKFIPNVQHDSFMMLYYLGIRMKDVVRIKGEDISRDGIRLGGKHFPWPDKDSSEAFSSLKNRLLKNAQQYPDARLFEARKSPLKAKDELRRAFHKGCQRYEEYGNHPVKDVDAKLPNFLVLGMPKAATTWIYRHLKAHPDVFVPQKELEFFNSFRYNFGFNWYKRQFLGWESETIGGDVSIGYFQSLVAPERIHKHLGSKDLKLIVLLREPVDRALSYYEMRLMKGNQLESFEDSINNPYFRNLFIDTSHYYLSYQNYLKFFSKDQILILLYEEIRRDPARAMEKVYAFLEVDPFYELEEVSKKTNAGKSLKNPELHRFMIDLGVICQSTIPFVGVRLRDFLLEVSKRINFYHDRQSYQIDPVVMDKLKKEFAMSNECLAELSGIDLASWGW
jgi:hypothetical protein